MATQKQGRFRRDDALAGIGRNPDGTLRALKLRTPREPRSEREAWFRFYARLLYTARRTIA
jgi:hypothetical protein